MCSQMQNLANTIFQQFFPTFLKNEGLRCLFFFMAVDFLLVSYIYFFSPENKQVPLEETDVLFGGASHAAKGGDILDKKTIGVQGVEIEKTECQAGGQTEGSKQNV